jgi:23S rRNA (uridine2552-2'-O)-methyltransferase
MAPDLDVLIGASSWDVVMSDMAPATSGNRFVDQTRSFQLVMRAIEIAERTLAPAGGFVAKIFQGPDFEEARRALVRQFDEVRIIKPPASRTESIETFLVALRFTPATTRG